MLTGGAPSTKDLVYLLGLLQGTNFVRASFAAGRADCLSLLFCGKLDIADIPALCELYDLGLCRPPRFLPPWLSDPPYLLAVLTFSLFTNRLSIEPVIQAAQRLLASAPVVRIPVPGEGRVEMPSDVLARRPPAAGSRREHDGGAHPPAGKANL